MPKTGTPMSNTAWGARGLPSVVTLAGPPDRMIACGAIWRSVSSVTVLNGWISQ